MSITLPSIEDEILAHSVTAIWRETWKIATNLYTESHSM
jgi:hypothetical protein